MLKLLHYTRTLDNRQLEVQVLPHNSHSLNRVLFSLSPQIYSKIKFFFMKKFEQVQAYILEAKQKYIATYQDRLRAIPQ